MHEIGIMESAMAAVIVEGRLREARQIQGIGLRKAR
jgi:hypothetical protein